MPAPIVPGWIAANEIFGSDDMSGKLIGWYGDSATGSSLYRAPRQWHTLDLVALAGLPAGTNGWAEFSAFMIITDLTPDIENLTLTMRPVGSTFGEGNYQAQTISVFYGDGQRGRQPLGTVRVIDSKVQVYWDWTSAGVPDTGPATSLIPLWINKWARWVDPAASPQPAPSPGTVNIPAGATQLTFS